ncbi:PLDc N-terminal domain-containing protein [Clostridium sp. UBA1652]|uniref:PLDc N-terminal domain-containing protein n=1 Tax=Clostridium sp. UBA1652 TaxID=1946348 RepID=UPI0039C8BBB1
MLQHITLLIPLVVIQLALQAYCLFHLYKRKKVRFEKKWIWAIVICLFSLVGPLAYLLGGGHDE